MAFRKHFLWNKMNLIHDSPDTIIVSSTGTCQRSWILFYSGNFFGSTCCKFCTLEDPFLCTQETVCCYLFPFDYIWLLINNSIPRVIVLKVISFYPLESHGNVCNSVFAYTTGEPSATVIPMYYSAENYFCQAWRIKWNYLSCSSCMD